MKIIVPIGEPLVELVTLLRDAQDIFLSKDDVVHTAVETIAYLPEANGQIMDIGSYLFDEPEMEVNDPFEPKMADNVDSVIHFAQGLCFGMIRQFKQYKLYNSNNVLPFNLERILDDGTIVLSSADRE